MKSKDTNERVQYIEDELMTETDLMKEVAEELAKDKKEIQLAPYEGKLLSFLIKLNKPTTLVEIGTLYGYSGLWMLEAMSEKAILQTVEYEEAHYKKAQTFFQRHEKKDQVQLTRASGLEFLKNWSPETPIDFLFLDADKGGYLDYLKLAMPFMRPGALVVADNSFLFGHALKKTPPDNYSKNTWEKMRTVNALLSGQTGEFYGLPIPTLQGMTVGVKL